MASENSCARKLLVFRLGEQHMAFPLNSIHSVIHMPALSRAPGMPSLLAGFLNLRGRAVPVLQLAQLFHLTRREPQLYTPLLIFKQGDLALIVDGVEKVVQVSTHDISPVQNKDVFNGCTVGEFRLSNRAIHLLSPKEILLEKERTSIQEFQTVAQERLAQVEENCH